MEIVKKISDEFLAQDHSHHVKLAHERQGWSVTALNPRDDAETLSRLALLLDVDDPSQLGKGHDAQAYHRKYSRLELYGAWRIEHPIRKSKYEISKQEVAQDISM